ncbi:MAG: WD40 repeat domain-containing serine/threonine protein kinase [Gemmataceae bacterium]
MAVLTSETVLADLRRLPLLSPEQLARVETAAGRHAPGPEKIVKRLTDKGWITPFQAEVLLSGKGGGLAFGHYVLLARLGEGGMGAVFKARHTRLDRIDAVKVIRPDRVASKLIAKRFLREIQLTADLNHPHIIKALDAGQVGSQLYLATEYVAGEDLTKTVHREGALSVADACLVIYQTALALRHINERGLIHRDLKPSNIMREEKTNSVKLLDLGLSNTLQELPASDSQPGHLTRDGVMLGTPDFMPPEQARNPHGVDIRADLYSLGCTFFYLLTGRTPYNGSPVEKLLHHATSPIPPLVLPRGPAPPALEAIVRKLMAKRPEDRHQSPQELIDELLALRPTHPVVVPTSGGEAPASGTTETVAEWQSEFELLIANEPSSTGANPIAREPRATLPARSVWWMVAAGGLVAASLGLFLVLRGKPAAETPAAPETAAAPEDAADELKLLKQAVANPSENKEQLRARVLAFRAKNMHTPTGAAAAGLLRKLPSPLDRLAPIKEAEHDAATVRIGEADGTVASIAFSPADEKLIVTRRGRPPEEWELPSIKPTNRYRSLTVRDEGIATLSADGRVVLAVDGGVLAVWSDGTMKSLPIASDRKAEHAAILPDGKSAIVALADSDDRLVKVSLTDGSITGRLDHPSEGVTGLAIAPDGSACLVFGPENLIRSLSVSSGKLLGAFDTPTGVESEPAGLYGPDVQRLYLVGAFRTAGRFTHGNLVPNAVYEVAQEKPNPFQPRAGTQGRPTCIAVSADETAVAVGTRSGRLHLYSASSGKAVQEFRFKGRVAALAFSTHGRVLAVALADGAVMLLPLKV